MAYAPQYVLSGWDTGQEIQQVGNTGLPTTFNNFLFSIWVCLGTMGRIVSLAGPEGWGTIDITQPQVQLTLLNGLFSQIFTGVFTVPIDNIRSHVIISVDSIHQIVQLYVNDAPVAQSSGAGWSGVGPFDTSYFPQWGIYSSGSSPPGAGIADCFIAAPATFFDLSVTANRRRFIHADLTSVDLGNDGSEPLGTQPPVFLTVRPGDTNPNHFASNNGFGGPWNYSPQPTSFEPEGLGCVAPTLPASPSSLALDDLVAIDQTPISVADTQIFLDWSDDRGHSYLIPVGRVLGPLGDYEASLQWQRLGYARDRVFRLTWSAPVATALQGAWIDLDAQAKT